MARSLEEKRRVYQRRLAKTRPRPHPKKLLLYGLDPQGQAVYLGRSLAAWSKADPPARPVLDEPVAQQLGGA